MNRACRSRCDTARASQREMEFRENPEFSHKRAQKSQRADLKKRPPFSSPSLFPLCPFVANEFSAGFTLLEMIMVLVIIAILAGLSMPAMHSAFVEQAVRKDAHQLALMVKTDRKSTR